MEFGEAVIVGDVAASEFSSRTMDVYSTSFSLHTLYEDPGSGAEHHVIRYPPGLRGRPHRHTAAHTMVVLEGTLSVNDRQIGSGGYAHVPGGQVMVHEAAGSHGCLFVIIFDGPFDIEIVDPG